MNNVYPQKTSARSPLLTNKQHVFTFEFIFLYPLNSCPPFKLYFYTHIMPIVTSDLDLFCIFSVEYRSKTKRLGIQTKGKLVFGSNLPRSKSNPLGSSLLLTISMTSSFEIYVSQSNSQSLSYITQYLTLTSSVSTVTEIYLKVSKLIF